MWLSFKQEGLLPSGDTFKLNALLLGDISTKSEVHVSKSLINVCRMLCNLLLVAKCRERHLSDVKTKKYTMEILLYNSHSFWYLCIKMAYSCLIMVLISNKALTNSFTIALEVIIKG